ncbi:hypothetical protein ACIBO2_29905 [Nonomuraea sp. NPDC050022]|uniref:hypothetical protein n=1 Tax=unclassified Nonomuraea TaxID=2593643 RepID=UPI0033D280E6
MITRYRFEEFRSDGAEAVVAAGRGRDVDLVRGAAFEQAGLNHPENRSRDRGPGG